MDYLKKEKFQNRTFFQTIIDSSGFLGRDFDAWVLAQGWKFDMAVMAISLSGFFNCRKKRFYLNFVLILIFFILILYFFISYFLRFYISISPIPKNI